MKTRYTKRVREEAALIASIAACRIEGSDLRISEIETMFHADSARLFWEAWDRAEDEVRIPGSHLFGVDVLSRELDAEAEALIRTGWTP